MKFKFLKNMLGGDNKGRPEVTNSGSSTLIQIIITDDFLELAVKKFEGTASEALEQLSWGLAGDAGLKIPVSRRWTHDSAQTPVLQLIVHEACCFLDKDQITAIRDFGE